MTSHDPRLIIAHAGALCVCVATAAFLPRWRRSRGPLLEMLALTALLALNGSSFAPWLPSSTVIAIVLAYTFVRTQRLLVQAPKVATTRSIPSWGFDQRAAARGLYLLPFAGSALWAVLPGGAHQLTVSDWAGPLITGLGVLSSSRLAIPLGVLSAVAAGFALYL